MSILDSLKRLFDPIAYRQQKEERRRKADTRADDAAPDHPPRHVQPKVCRVCGLEGTGDFCTRCLAGTMVDRRR